MMRENIRTFFCQITLAAAAGILCGSFHLAGAAGIDQTATDHVRATMTSFIRVLRDSDFGSTAGRREQLHTIFVKRFDPREIARKALGQHWDARSEDERQVFTDLFVRLLEDTYFEKIDQYLARSTNFTEQNISYGREIKRTDYVIVETTVHLEQESTIPVLYQLKRAEQQWHIVDIAIEGVSLLKNYRVQFGEILGSASFAELLERMRTRQGFEKQSSVTAAS